MDFNDYQAFAKTTAIYPRQGQNIQYAVLGLCGEVGEVANKVKKIERDDGGRITHESREKIAEELGDVLWYVAMAADEINLSLETITKKNVAKLKARVSKNTIHGSGDNR